MDIRSKRSRPIAQTTRFCGMNSLPPLVYGARHLDRAALQRHAADYRALLARCGNDHV